MTAQQGFAADQAAARVSLLHLAAAARLAGAQIMHWYHHSGLQAQAKSDESPVTQADLAAHDALMAALPQLLPGVPIVSEEGGSEVAMLLRMVASEPVYWLIDPLDGTRDYLRRTGDFSVNIALMVAGKPVVGCVYAPVRGDCFVGAAGRGAFKQSHEGAALTPARTRAADPEAFVCLVSRSHEAGEGDRLHQAFPRATVKHVGSALKYAHIVDAVADVSVRTTPTSLWDTAAAQCLLEVAGGAMLGFDGQPLSYRTGSLVNPPFVALGDPSLPWRAILDRLKPLPGP